MMKANNFHYAGKNAAYVFANTHGWYVFVKGIIFSEPSEIRRFSNWLLEIANFLEKQDEQSSNT